MPARKPTEIRRIYLDHQATTPLDPAVLDAMMPYLTGMYGNAASRQHSFGQDASAAVEHARNTIQSMLGARNGTVVFTSGATEACNLALTGCALSKGARGRHVVTVATEHRAVLDTCAALTGAGCELTVVPVDGSGHVSTDAIRRAIRPDTCIVTVMHANNEIGTIHDIEAVGAVCVEAGVLFHTDATQSFGRLPLDVITAHADLVSLSAHKLYGPKGCGALYLSERALRLRPSPLMHGGGHERGLRSGTLNVPAIAGFGAAARLAAACRDEEAVRLNRLAGVVRDSASALGACAINGDAGMRLPGNLSLRFEGVRADLLMSALREFALATGSACGSAQPGPSHVLQAIGLDAEQCAQTIRIGIGRFTSEEDIAYFCGCLADAVRTIRDAVPNPGLA